jgi:hypothetical protein
LFRLLFADIKFPLEKLREACGDELFTTAADKKISRERLQRKALLPWPPNVAGRRKLCDDF